MSRRVVAFAGIVLFTTLGCLAQGSRTRQSLDRERKNNSQPPSIRVPSEQVERGSISIARLSVPRKASDIYQKARKAFGKHEYAEAQRRLDQALQSYPAFPEALTLRGYIQLDLNQRETAESSLQSALRSDPTYGPAYLILSDLYNRELRFEEALAMTQRAAVLTDSWVAHYEMARAFLGKHQYDLALKTSDAALHTNRGTLLHVAKAHALIGLGRYPEAAAELRTYLDYRPAGEGSQDARDMLLKMQGMVGE